MVKTAILLCFYYLNYNDIFFQKRSNITDISFSGLCEYYETLFVNLSKKFDNLRFTIFKN